MSKLNRKKNRDAIQGFLILIGLFIFVGLLFFGDSEEDPKNTLPLSVGKQDSDNWAELQAENCASVRTMPEFMEAIMNREEEITSVFGRVRIIALTPVNAPEKYTEILVKGAIDGTPAYLFQRMAKGCETTYQKFYFSTSEADQVIRRNGLERR